MNEPGMMAALSPVVEEARRLRLKTYIVGGCVRDWLLKRPVTDLDVVVEGNAIKLAQAVYQELQGELTIHEAFKTATIKLADQHLIDFATARREVYARPGAYPKVSRSHIRNDLFRRDFTINAMAMRIDTGKFGVIVDPFKGRQDLAHRLIRVMHANSFIDDPTRILRAARFKERFRFALEEKTERWLKQAILNKALDSIKPQRYDKEFKKIMQEPDPRPAMECLRAWGALKGAEYVSD